MGFSTWASPYMKDSIYVAEDPNYACVNSGAYTVTLRVKADELLNQPAYPHGMLRVGMASPNWQPAYDGYNIL